jgi:hypothetical protein
LAENYKVLRYKAWFAAGGTPDKTEYPPKSPAVLFPVTSFTIQAAVNAVPVLSVTLAAGRRVDNGTPSPLHTRDGEILRKVSGLPWAQLWFQPEGAAKPQLVFEGFVAGTSPVSAFSAAELQVTVKHWLYALDIHPAAVPALHPSAPAVFLHNLYFRMIKGTSGTSTPNETKQGLTIGSIVSGILAGDEGVFRQDIIANGVLSLFRWLVKEQASHGYPYLGGEFPAARLLYDLPLNTETIVQTRMRPGDADNTGTAPVFPKLSLAIDEANLLDRMYHSFANISVEQAQQNTFWSLLLYLASEYGFLVIPRANEVRFIPKWFLPPIPKDEVKPLDGAISLNGSWEHSRKIGASVLYPGNPGSLDWGGVNAPPGETIPPLPPPYSLYGKYVPEPSEPGILLLNQRPGWAGMLFTPKASASIGDMNQTEANEKTSTDASGTSAVQIDMQGFPFYDRLAEEAYWEEVHIGRRADVICPIRFDVCPGSTVKVRTGKDSRVMSLPGGITRWLPDWAEPLFKDYAERDYIGFVSSVRIAMDTMNATAVSQYTLLYVRDSGAGDAKMEKHPFYSCPPFRHAGWTD